MRSQSFLILTISVALSLCLPQLAFTQTDNCTIKGKIINDNFDDVVYLLKGNRPFVDLADARIVDSIATDKGIFTFKCSVSYTDFYAIRLKYHRKGFVLIGSPNSIINIQCDTASFYFPEINGSTENTIRKKYQDGLKPLVVKMNGYADSLRYAHDDTVLYNKYVSQNIYWAGKIRQYNLLFIQRHPNTLTSLDMYNTYYDLYPSSAVKRYLHNLPKALHNNPMVKEIAYKKFQEKSELAKIKKFYDLNFFDTLHQPIGYKKYHGKIVLIDFWASWCKPCIENMPIIDSIYKSNIGRPFAILSVSLDETMERWKRGMALYPVSWDNVSDLKGIKGLAARYFNIRNIPRYILLNTDGSTISSDVPIDELGKLITQYLAGKN
jgi:thiol-disulfide isomerase/thioredoxin